MFQRIKEEGRAFQEALASAPVEPVQPDLWGMRHLMRRLGWLLLREHTEPRQLGLAVLVGVMIGASPFYLFHTALVLLVAFTFGLNKLAVWIASNVSLPIFAPFLTFVSMQAGHRFRFGEWLPLTIPGMRERLANGGAMELGIDLWFDWLIGSIPVGAVLGAALGGVTWVVAKGRARARSGAESE